MRNYNENIGRILKNHNLIICSCEYGTDGLVSSLLSNTSEATSSTYVGGFVINSDSMLKETMSVDVSDPSKIVNDMCLSAMRKTKADIGISTYIYKGKAHICVVFLSKKYERNEILNSVQKENARTATSVIAMSFLSDLLEQMEK
jgi:nicotinamide mononucleotide (NMN) deamidase PncC